MPRTPKTPKVSAIVQSLVRQVKARGLDLSKESERQGGGVGHDLHRRGKDRVAGKEKASSPRTKSN